MCLSTLRTFSFSVQMSRIALYMYIHFLRLIELFLYNYVTAFQIHSCLSLCWNWCLSFHTVPIGEPLNFTVTASGPRQVTFSWKPPSLEKQRGHITSYNLSCTSARDGSIVTASFETEQDDLELDLFSPATMYMCRLVAMNSVGPGPAAVGNTATSSDGEVEFPQEVCSAFSFFLTVLVVAIDDQEQWLLMSWKSCLCATVCVLDWLCCLSICVVISNAFIHVWNTFSALSLSLYLHGCTG